MSGFEDDFDEIYDHNHDGHLDPWEQGEKDWNIEESDQWMRSHSSGSGGFSSGSHGSHSGAGSDDNTEGCCYLILIGIVAFLILGILSVIF